MSIVDKIVAGGWGCGFLILGLILLGHRMAKNRRKRFQYYGDK